MPSRLRTLAILALTPLVLAGHCKEDCGPPSVRLVGARRVERTIYTAGVLTTRGGPIAKVLAPFERREIVVDVSRPVAVALVEPRAARMLARADGSKLAPGDRGEGYRVIGVVEQRGKVPLFADAAAFAEAEREGYDAVLLVPRGGERAPWEASVAVEVGRRVERRNDDAGKCVDAERSPPAVPEWSLFPLPPGCGDGVRASDEDCDDGNARPGDGCSPYCVKER
jgi:cysteine-rich repeat protein